MGYYLQGLISRENVLKTHTSEYQNVTVIPLVQGVGLVPLIDEAFEEIGPDDVMEPFEKLSSDVEELAQKISVDCPVIYVEAEFFGGTGTQVLMAWAKGSRTMKPLKSTDAINQGLKILGVKKHGAVDEFDAVGLGKHRSTEEWIK